LTRVRAALEGGPKSRGRIARFILDRPSRVRNVSIWKVAGDCGVSVSTVSRFCADLGYGGYKEFQLDLATALGQEPEPGLDEFAADASPESVIRHVFGCIRQSVGDTEKVVDHDVLIRVARAIQRARRVLVLGVGASARVARLAAERFVSLGLTATAVSDATEQAFATTNLTRDDVVIGISHTGHTSQAVAGVRAARRRKATTVAVTNYPHSPLAKASRFRLITALQEHRMKLVVSSSEIAQMAVIEAIYYVLGSWASAEAEALAAEAEREIHQLLHWPLANRPRRRGK